MQSMGSGGGGVEIEKGKVVVDVRVRQTTVPGASAIGDLIDGPMLAS